MIVTRYWIIKTTDGKQKMKEVIYEGKRLTGMFELTKSIVNDCPNEGVKYKITRI